MWLLVLAHLTRAHVPHPDVLSVGADDGLAQVHPWFLLHHYGRATMLFRSDDGGNAWDAVGGPPTADLLTHAGWTDDGIGVLVGGDRYWWTADDGATWQVEELDEPATGFAAGSTMVVTTEQGVRTGRPGEPLEAVRKAVSFARVDAGSGGFAAVDIDGRVWALGLAGTWDQLPELDGGVAVALKVQDAVYGANDLGQVSRYAGGVWTPCGPTPYAAYPHPAVVQMAASRGKLLVSAASRGPAISADDCATWDDVAAPLDSLFGGAGAVFDDRDATTALAVADEHVIQGGWAGFAFSEDLGGSWEKRIFLAPDFLRGLAISPEFDTDGTVLLGGYSGGVERTTDGGVTWDAPSYGLDDPNIQDILFAPDRKGRRVFAVANHDLRRSDDGGVNWEQLTLPFAEVRGFLVDRDDTLWLAGTSPGGNALGFIGNAAKSVDGGESWMELGGLTLEGVIGGFFKTTERICAIAETDVACSGDGGSVWSVVFHGTDSVVGFAEARVDGADRMLVATDHEGVWVSEEGGPWSLSLDAAADPVLMLVAADDGTLFAPTRSSRLLRSDDGGEHWFDLGFQLTAGMHVLEPRADFALHDELLIATYDGAWLVKGDVASRFGRYQRLDDASEFLRAKGVDKERDPSSSLGTCTPIGNGGSLVGEVRGTTISVVGRVRGRGGEVLVRIDETEEATLGGTEAAAGSTLYTSPLLADGWHHVEVIGIAGDTVCVDAIEGRAAGAALDWEPPKCGEGCGKGTTTIAGVFLLSLLRRRDTRARCSAPSTCSVPPSAPAPTIR